MQKREKILAAGLGGVILFWFGLPWFEGQILAPLREMETRETALTTETEDLHKQQLDLARKDAEMKTWQGLSLPPDPLDAQRLYQEWLTNLALISGMEITKITLDRRSSEADTYVTIPVTIEAQARLQELTLFLQRFESADLLQRIARCDVISPANEGDPELSVTLTAEGLSLSTAAARARLFPQTELRESVAKEMKQITVVSQSAFPRQPPFLIRIENEFMNVTSMKNNTWSVQRGVEKTFGKEHEMNAVVELFPLQEASGTSRSASKIWEQSVFVKPAPEVEYNSQLASTSLPVAIRGQSWTWKLDVKGWNPAFGTPQFELISAPPGMKLDERTGIFSWSVGSSIELGNRPIEVLVWGTNGRNAGLTTSVNVRVRDPNQKPVIEQAGPLRFFIGRESKAKISAHDPESDTKGLKYALSAAPTGMTMDSTSGEIRWTPTEDMEPQQLEISVQVTDADEMPESATANIPITLEEDSARFTYLTGSVKRTSGKQEAWIYDRVTNRSLTVQAGEEFHIADFDLTVDKIGPTFIEVRRTNQLYRWQFEQPLSQMTLLETPPAEPAPKTVPVVP